MSYIGAEPTTAAFPFDQFSGNGSTTAFTLTYAPASTTSIIVAISGVVQNPNLYSIVGTTLTFSPAPPSGTNNISVLYLGLPVITPAGTGDFTTINNSGNLTFTGTGNRIRGDFTTATIANRVMFQTSTANGVTSVAAIPNGTGVVGAFNAFNNSDPTNAAFISLATTTGAEARVTSGITGTGSYLPLTFYTGGSERMRVDTSGNVGIGTSSPTSKLHVEGTIKSQAANTNRISINHDGTNGSVANTGGDMLLYANGSQAMIFHTNSTERARIDSSGNLLVGTTTSNARVTNQFEGLTSIGMSFNDTSNSGTTQAIVFRKNTSTQVGSIQTSTTATSYVTSSDYRLKENIAPMTGALSKVAALKPVTYKWKSDGSNSQGFIAHELAEVVPEAVTGEKDAVNEDGSIKAQGIDTSFLVATLTAAIQELKAEVDELRAQLEAK